jgi:hypothetical protein
MSNQFSKIIESGTWLSRFLDTNGDSSGAIEQNVDGSVTPITFSWKVPVGYHLFVYRLIATIQDAGSFDADKYGNGLVLTNGLDFGSTDPEGVFTSATPQLRIKTNSDWASYSYDLTIHSQGQGDSIAVIRYTFLNDGKPIQLTQEQSFVIIINDDLTPLNNHKVRIAGVLVKVDVHAPKLPWE